MHHVLFDKYTPLQFEHGRSPTTVQSGSRDCSTLQTQENSQIIQKSNERVSHQDFNSLIQIKCVGATNEDYLLFESRIFSASRKDVCEVYNFYFFFSLLSGTLSLKLCFLQTFPPQTFLVLRDSFLTFLLSNFFLSDFSFFKVFFLGFFFLELQLFFKNFPLILLLLTLRFFRLLLFRLFFSYFSSSGSSFFRLLSPQLLSLHTFLFQTPLFSLSDSPSS